MGVTGEGTELICRSTKSFLLLWWWQLTFLLKLVNIHIAFKAHNSSIQCDCDLVIRSYDAEGALWSSTACTLTYLGLMSGRVLLHFSEHGDRLRCWLIAACVLLLVAGVVAPSHIYFICMLSHDSITTINMFFSSLSWTPPPAGRPLSSPYYL